MAVIERRIADVTGRLHALERHAERRERFVAAIDWSAMTDEDCFEARIREDDIEEDLAFLALELDHLNEMAATIH